MLTLTGSHLVVGLVSFLIPIVVQFMKNRQSPSSAVDPLANHPLLQEIRDLLKGLKSGGTPVAPPVAPVSPPDWSAIVNQLLALLQAQLAPPPVSK